MISGQNIALGAPAASVNGTAPRCGHLDGLTPVTPLSDDCPDCRDQSVRLVVCLTCGWVACSDDSPGLDAPGRTTRKRITPSPPASCRERHGDGATSTSASSDPAP